RHVSVRVVPEDRRTSGISLDPRGHMAHEVRVVAAATVGTGLIESPLRNADFLVVFLAERGDPVQPVAGEFLSVDGGRRLRSVVTLVDTVQQVGPARGVTGCLAESVVHVECHRVDVTVARIEVFELVAGATDIAAHERIPDDLKVRPGDAAHAGHDVPERGDEVLRPARERFSLLVADSPAHLAAVELPADPEVRGAEARGYQVLGEGLEIAVRAPARDEVVVRDVRLALCGRSAARQHGDTPDHRVRRTFPVRKLPRFADMRPVGGVNEVLRVLDRACGAKPGSGFFNASRVVFPVVEPYSGGAGGRARAVGWSNRQLDTARMTAATTTCGDADSDGQHGDSGNKTADEYLLH